MNKYLISIESGKGITKYIGLDVCNNIEKEGQFETRFDDIGSLDITAQNDNYVVEHDRFRWLLGDTATQKNTDITKANDLHKLCIYTAITTFLEPNTTDNSIIIGITCPASIYTSKEAKKAFADMIKGSIQITVNNQKYSFAIDKILVKSEGEGIIYIIPKEFDENDCVIVDIGCLNVNTMGVKKGKLQPMTYATYNLGHFELLNKLNKFLNTFNNGKNINANRLNDALDNKILKLNGKEYLESTAIIDSVKEMHVKEIMTEVSAQIDLEDYDKIVFGGGCSKVLNDIIIKTYPNALVVDDPVMAAVRGWFEFLKKKYAKDIING